MQSDLTGLPSPMERYCICMVTTFLPLSHHQPGQGQMACRVKGVAAPAFCKLKRKGALHAHKNHQARHHLQILHPQRGNQTMIVNINQDQVVKKLSTISELSREQLIKDWRQTHKQCPPKGISRRLLEFSAAYHLQAKTYGGLKPNIRRKLRQPTKQAKKPTPSPSIVKKSDRLSPGTKLLREWHGDTYTVEVVDIGFVYGGQTYKSLSEIARTITGTRWSGPRFFGL